jgi:hypothetical protein
MPEQENEQAISRRTFLRNATLTAAAAVSVGAGAAALTDRADLVITSGPAPASLPLIPKEVGGSGIAVPEALQSAQMIANAPADAAELLAKLASSQAENLRLQAALDAAQRDMEGLRLNSDSQRSVTDDLSLQLSSAEERIGILGGLVALYEQLDAADVGSAMQEGLAVVAGSIGGLVAEVPTLQEGLAMGGQALDELESHLPVIENGRMWLEAQAAKVESFYAAIEGVLQNVLASVGNFLELVENWFEGIRKWLPGNLEQKASQVITSFTNLIAETPPTVTGLRSYVAEPLDHWLARDGDDTPRLQRNLVKPLREQVIVRAADTIGRVQTLQLTYQEQVDQKLAGATANREAVRSQIAGYRQQHSV